MEEPIPVEVKVADKVKSKRLDFYMEALKPSYIIKASSKRFGSEDGKKRVPSTPSFVSEMDHNPVNDSHIFERYVGFAVF